MLMLITASEIQAKLDKIWGRRNPYQMTVLPSAKEQNWTFGYISALNEMMRQRFETPQDEFMAGGKEFCADNPDAVTM